MCHICSIMFNKNIFNILCKTSGGEVVKQRFDATNIAYTSIITYSITVWFIQSEWLLLLLLLAVISFCWPHRHMLKKLRFYELALLVVGFVVLITIGSVLVWGSDALISREITIGDNGKIGVQFLLILMVLFGLGYLFKRLFKKMFGKRVNK
jgi:hypothetical protein